MKTRRPASQVAGLLCQAVVYSPTAPFGRRRSFAAWLAARCARGALRAENTKVRVPPRAVDRYGKAREVDAARSDVRFGVMGEIADEYYLVHDVLLEK